MADMRLTSRSTSASCDEKVKPNLLLNGEEAYAAPLISGDPGRLIYPKAF